MIPGDFESKFINAGDGETKERLRVEEATGESQAMLCFGSLETWRQEAGQGGTAVSSLGRKTYNAEVSQGGAAFSSLESQRKRGPWRQFQRESLG